MSRVSPRRISLWGSCLCDDLGDLFHAMPSSKVECAKASNELLEPSGRQGVSCRSTAKQTAFVKTCTEHLIHAAW